MEEPIRTRKGKLAGRDSTTHDWVVWCKSKKGMEEINPLELNGNEIFFKYDETKSKEVKGKKSGSKVNACRG